MKLDHGILNIPLSKRGDIDAQIDRHKAETARLGRTTRKASYAALEASRAEAKTALKAVSLERFAALAAHCGCSVPALRKRLRSDAHWKPQFVFKLLGDSR